MKYHILYSSGDVVKNNSSNTTLWPYNEEAEKVITWELNDYTLTRKFIHLHQKMFDNATIQDGGRYLAQEQSICTSVSAESILESRRHHNSLIRTLQALKKAPKVNGQPPITFDTPDSLLVNELDPYDRCEDKFNKGHYHFETQAKIWQDAHVIEKVNIEYYMNVVRILSELNETCHYNEQTLYNVQPEEYRTVLKYTYLSHNSKPDYLRAHNFTDKLEDKDYEHFCFQSGKKANTLFLDFGTVGKSLTEVASTNDLELLHTKGVTQQTSINPWVRYDWSVGAEKTEDRYNEWLINNNVKDYYDLSLPMMTPGLHPLGECISHDFSTPKEFANYIEATPKIVGTKLEI